MGPCGSTPTFNQTLYGTSFNLSRVGYEKSQFFISGTAHSYVPAQPSDERRQMEDHDRRERAIHDADSGIPPHRPQEVQRDGRGRMAQCERRDRRQPGLDAVPQRTGSRRLRLGGGFRPAGRCRLSEDPPIPPSTRRCRTQATASRTTSSRRPAGRFARTQPLILGGLRPHTLIAAGESQSAGRLMTYIDAVQPIAHVYQGFLVHSQFGTGAPLSQAPQTSYAAPTPTTIRSDIGVPVFEFETETDVDNSNLTDRLHYGNPKWFRLWEVAGSSHYDYYGLAIGPDDTGNGQGAVKNLAAMQNPTRTPVGGFNWPSPSTPAERTGRLTPLSIGSTGGSLTGTPPPRASLLGDHPRISPVVFKLDANGNVIGGVRTPQVDAPIAALGSQGNSGGFCFLFGSTVPYSATHLASLYKNHGQFVSAWARAVQGDRRLGSCFRPMHPSSCTLRLSLKSHDKAAESSHTRHRTHLGGGLIEPESSALMPQGGTPSRRRSYHLSTPLRCSGVKTADRTLMSHSR